MPLSVRGIGALTAAALLALGMAAAAAPPESKYTVKQLDEAVPGPLAPDVRGTLTKTAYRVHDPNGKVVCDVWLRADVPMLGKFQEQVDLKYALEPGTLVGAIRFPAATSDYRSQNLKAGVYTLRYAQQPQDGNHLGTAVYRDFLVLGAAAEDKKVGEVTQEQAIKQSKKGSGSTHPAILSLLPPDKELDKLPAVLHDGSLNLEALAAKTGGKLGDKTKDLPIALVVVGHAD